MQVGFRPRLKARPSLVDLLRRSQSSEGHFPVDGASSSPTTEAPQSAPAANQKLLSTSLASEDIASTYQLPGSPFKLDDEVKPPSSSPLSPQRILRRDYRPLSPCCSSDDESDFEDAETKPVATSKMAPVSLVPRPVSPLDVELMPLHTAPSISWTPKLTLHYLV